MQRGEVWWVQFDERRLVVLLSGDDTSGIRVMQVVAPAGVDISGWGIEVMVGASEGLPFEGVLTLVDVASDKAPSGARGHRVILSRARGDAGPDSDFDFLVVERDPRNRHAEMVRLGRALRPLGMPFDVIVVSERYAEDWGAVEGTMVHAALTEGRVLHAAT